MSAQDGTNCRAYFCIAAKTATPESLTWLQLGMLNTKSIKSTWKTADTTADSTADRGVTAMATRLGHSFSTDAIAYDDDAYNQRTLKNQFYNPSATTGGQPEVWLKLENPASNEAWTGYYLMTSWTNDKPKHDVVTWSIEATCQGKLTYDDGVA